MLTAAALKGLDQAQQYERIRSEVSAGTLSKTAAVALSVELKLPEELQSALANSKFVSAGYAEVSGKVSEHRSLPASSPLFLAANGSKAPAEIDYRQHKFTSALQKFTNEVAKKLDDAFSRYEGGSIKQLAIAVEGYVSFDAQQALSSFLSVMNRPDIRAEVRAKGNIYDGDDDQRYRG